MTRLDYLSVGAQDTRVLVRRVKCSRGAVDFFVNATAGTCDMRHDSLI